MWTVDFLKRIQGILSFKALSADHVSKPDICPMKKIAYSVRGRLAGRSADFLDSALSMGFSSESPFTCVSFGVDSVCPFKEERLSSSDLSSANDSRVEEGDCWL